MVREPEATLPRLYIVNNTANPESKKAEDVLVDEFLVTRCQTGDRVALSALIAKWQPSFLRYATVMTRDRDQAADVLQDAWMKIIRSLPTLREPLRFPAWAYRIINNQCLDLIRQRRPQEPVEELADSTAIRQLEEKEQVWCILEQLTPEHRSVLALHYLQGFEVAEIASIVGKPQGTVKSRLFNAREKFRQVFEAQQNETHGEINERTGREDPGGLECRYGTAGQHT